MRQIIRLTEGDLHKIVRNSVNRILSESYSPYDYDEYYTPEDLSNLNTIKAYYTPSDGHISVNVPEGYDDGEVEIPFLMVPEFEPDYYGEDWVVSGIYTTAADDETETEYDKYSSEIDKKVEDDFDFYKRNYFDNYKVPGI